MGLDTFEADWEQATENLRRSRPSAVATLDTLKNRLVPSVPSNAGVGDLAIDLQSLLGEMTFDFEWHDPVFY
jgi:hypothetical protein